MLLIFFFKQKTAYEMRISDWSSDVCSSDLIFNALGAVDRNQAAPDFFAPYIRAAIETSDDPEVKRAGEYMLGFNGLYQDRDGDHRYDNPGLTLYRTWLQVAPGIVFGDDRSEEHTSELQSLMRISYAVFCLKKKHT